MFYDIYRTFTLCAALLEESVTVAKQQHVKSHQLIYIPPFDLIWWTSTVYSIFWWRGFFSALKSKGMSNEAKLRKYIASLKLMRIRIKIWILAIHENKLIMKLKLNYTKHENKLIMKLKLNYRKHENISNIYFVFIDLTQHLGYRLDCCGKIFSVTLNWSVIGCESKIDIETSIS